MEKNFNEIKNFAMALGIAIMFISFFGVQAGIFDFASAWLLGNAALFLSIIISALLIGIAAKILSKKLNITYFKALKHFAKDTVKLLPALVLALFVASLFFFWGLKLKLLVSFIVTAVFILFLYGYYLYAATRQRP